MEVQLIRELQSDVREFLRAIRQEKRAKRREEKQKREVEDDSNYERFQDAVRIIQKVISGFRSLERDDYASFVEKTILHQVLLFDYGRALDGLLDFEDEFDVNPQIIESLEDVLFVLEERQKRLSSME